MSGNIIDFPKKPARHRQLSMKNLHASLGLTDVVLVGRSASGNYLVYRDEGLSVDEAVQLLEMARMFIHQTVVPDYEPDDYPPGA